MAEARARLHALQTRYPSMFPSELAFLHDDGWCALLETLCRHIQPILDTEPQASMQVLQVKEKFGTLRFYYSLQNATDELSQRIRAAVNQAESASGHICERCGCAGTLQTDASWWRTLCPACRANST